MYNCRHVHEKACALIDDELPARQILAVRMHLLLCSSCRRFMRQLRLLVRSVGYRGATESLSAEKVDQILDKLP